MNSKRVIIQNILTGDVADLLMQSPDNYTRGRNFLKNVLLSSIESSGSL